MENINVGEKYSYTDGREVTVVQVIEKTKRAEVKSGNWNPFWVDYDELKPIDKHWKGSIGFPYSTDEDHKTIVMHHPEYGDITINPELDKYSKMDLFKDQVEEAKKILDYVIIPVIPKTNEHMKNKSIATVKNSVEYTCFLATCPHCQHENSYTFDKEGNQVTEFFEFEDVKNPPIMAREQTSISERVWDFNNNVDAVVECLEKNGFVKIEEDIHKLVVDNNDECFIYKLVIDDTAECFCTVDKILVTFRMVFNNNSDSFIDKCALVHIQSVEEMELILRRVYELRHFVKKGTYER